MYVEELTDRELQVLGLLASGRTNAAIADILVISPFTVGNHLRNIYGKLGVRSRSAATRAALERGLVGPAAEVQQPAPPPTRFRLLRPMSTITALHPAMPTAS